MQHGDAVNSEQLNMLGANIYFIFSTDTVNDMENAAQIQLDRHNYKAQLGGKITNIQVLDK